MANNISVIIRCRNEERWIGHAIQSCADFFESPEIIIIDDNSTDNSRRVISTFDYLNIKVMSIEGDYTPGKALNMGVRQATNETILILSAHCVLTSVNYFDKINVLLSDHVAVWGKQIPIWNGKKVNRRYVWSNFKEEDQINYHSPQENRPFLHNALCFYNKSDLIIGSRIIKCQNITDQIKKIYPNNYIGYLLSKYGGIFLSLLLFFTHNRFITDSLSTSSSPIIKA